MFTRDLTPQYGEGLPLALPNVHHLPITDVWRIDVSPTPTLNLPAETVMVDPSDRLTWRYGEVQPARGGNAGSSVTGAFTEPSAGGAG